LRRGHERYDGARAAPRSRRGCDVDAHRRDLGQLLEEIDVALDERRLADERHLVPVLEHTSNTRVSFQRRFQRLVAVCDIR
jgi:hypothetical protein